MFTKFEKVLVWILLGAIVWILIVNLLTDNKSPTQLATGTNLSIYSYQKSSNNLTKWLDKLETYEKCPDDGIRDNNGKMSYSCLCFQMATFKQYYKRYYPEAGEMEQSDWLNQISDCEFQKELAYKMIQENYQNWKHWNWSITVRGFSKPPK